MKALMMKTELPNSKTIPNLRWKSEARNNCAIKAGKMMLTQIAKL
jgi:hypothetical protein